MSREGWKTPGLRRSSSGSKKFVSPRKEGRGGDKAGPSTNGGSSGPAEAVKSGDVPGLKKTVSVGVQVGPEMVEVACGSDEPMTPPDQDPPLPPATESLFGTSSSALGICASDLASPSPGPLPRQREVYSPLVGNPDKTYTSTQIVEILDRERPM